jgi:predicted component of type VI protein secretion system
MIDVLQNLAEGLRFLKELDELDDEAITSLRIHPNGRRLLVLTKHSRLVTFNISKLFSINSQYAGVKCINAPIQSTFSPDGRFIISGEFVPPILHTHRSLWLLINGLPRLDQLPYGLGLTGIIHL